MDEKAIPRPRWSREASISNDAGKELCALNPELARDSNDEAHCCDCSDDVNGRSIVEAKISCKIFFKARKFRFYEFYVMSSQAHFPCGPRT